MSRISDYMDRWRTATPVIQSEIIGYIPLPVKGAVSDPREPDEPLTCVEDRKIVEQRLEAIENSIDHMSDQMKLIIKVMSVEYKLGETND